MLVRDLMSSPAVTVTPDTPVPQIAALMRNQHVGCVVVTDPDGGLLGIVTDSDFLFFNDIPFPLSLPGQPGAAHFELPVRWFPTKSIRKYCQGRSHRQTDRHGLGQLTRRDRSQVLDLAHLRSQLQCHALRNYQELVWTAAAHHHLQRHGPLSRSSG